MTKKQMILMVLATVGSVAIASADSVNGITMDFVPITGAGNSGDNTANGTYGAVGYDYRMGVNEVSIEQFQASPISDANANYWNDGTRNVGASAPVVAISWHEAAMYCNWLTSGFVDQGAYTVSGGLVTGVTEHNGAAMDSLVSTYGMVYFLPTENEWFKAAYYKDGNYSLYANGTGSAPVHGVNANFNSPGGYANGPAWTVNSGTDEQNGTRNMMGNVWEWLESADDGTLNNLGSENMAFRGGDYFQGASLLDKEHRGGGELPSAEYYSVGFRVAAAIPEPGTISFMSMSTLGLFFTRTVRRRKRLGQTLVPVRREHLCDTFGDSQDRQTADELDEGVDYLALMLSEAKEGCLQLWAMVRHSFKEADKVFWNRMVASHERKVARRNAFRQSAKQKAINRLDAFLALIMK